VHLISFLNVSPTVLCLDEDVAAFNFAQVTVAPQLNQPVLLTQSKEKPRKDVFIPHSVICFPEYINSYKIVGSNLRAIKKKK